MLLRSQARCVQPMQKALTQMNIQLANVISDVVGETGQKILRAIVAGERDGRVLAAMKNVRIRASSDEIAKSLQGHFRAEHLFACKQALDAFDFCGTQLGLSATPRSRPSCTACTLTTASPPRARREPTHATRRSSSCAGCCSRCAGSISRASTAST
jgi:hypothetical protein